MPGWHAQTKALVEKGELTVAGIVQEQHPDRAALYMQWQQMDWPLLADPFNDLGISVVPITLLIDEHGVIRYDNPRKGDLKTFLATSYETKGGAQKIESQPEDIETLRKKVKGDSKDARSHFQLGVAYRMRHDSDERRASDFADAVASWSEALRLNPNQYIWRRRIQQYGPRLDKPYSFYDWVQQARRELVARGETPHPLTCEPTGSEFAYPEKKKGQKAPAAAARHPDPEGKVTHDEEGAISAQAVVVHSTKGGSPAARVHLRFQPGEVVTWTNDAGNLSFHLSDEGSEVFTIHDFQESALPKEISTKEERAIEFEVRPKKGQKLPKTIQGAAFYFICTSDDGTCRYLRKDIEITIR